MSEEIKKCSECKFYLKSSLFNREDDKCGKSGYWTAVERSLDFSDNCGWAAKFFEPKEDRC